jgi:hypothetical protein
VTANRAWSALLVIAGLFAAIAVGQWVEALWSGRPVLYGEGAVANAANLLRDGNPYLDTTGTVAANYPPLYLWLASLADPFRSGRLVTISGALAVALIIWWRARGAGTVPRAALALTWLALTPVATWGAAVKPDLLAVALTVGGVAALDHSVSPGLGSRAATARSALLGGALLAAAVWAKPTALLPAAAVMAYVLAFGRPVFARAALGGLAIGALALAHAYTLGIGDVWRHVVVWNALPWSADQALLIVVVGAAAIGILVAVAARGGAFAGPALAYALGAGGVMLLGGREGATINYLLDLTAATVYAVATAAPRLSTAATFPLAAAAQIALGFAILAPFGLIPGREAGPGAWHPADAGAVRVYTFGGGTFLADDSGPLVRAGVEPVIDDLFLWSRLAEAGVIDPAPVLERVRAGEIDLITSEVELERIGEARPFERARWHPDLVAAILARYERVTFPGAPPPEPGGPGWLWLYEPR